MEAWEEEHKDVCSDASEEDGHGCDGVSSEDSGGSICDLVELDMKTKERPEKKKEEGREELREWSGYVEMLSGVVAAMKREGPVGRIRLGEFRTLEVFGEKDAKGEIEKLTEKTCADAAVEIESLAKCAEKKSQRRGERKPVRYLVKKGVETKLERMKGDYEDRQFISAICREYTYKRGINLYRVTAKKEKTEVDYTVHEKMAGFCAPTGACEWEDWKRDEFFASILK